MLFNYHNLLPDLPIPSSPVTNLNIFSAVLGTLSAYNSMLIRLAGPDPGTISKYTTGLLSSCTGNVLFSNGLFTLLSTYSLPSSNILPKQLASFCLFFFFDSTHMLSSFLIDESVGSNSIARLKSLIAAS